MIEDDWDSIVENYELDNEERKTLKVEPEN
jgi:hypothetical protein